LRLIKAKKAKFVCCRGVGILRVKGSPWNYPQENCSETGIQARARFARASDRRGRLWGCDVRGNSSRAEHYRKLAVKYHELGKFAQPSYLGDFYRGVAVRYVFMAQEASERAKREIELNAGQADLPPSTSDNSGGIFDFPAVGPEGDCENKAH
jgi:hypothetical protein